MYNEFKNHEKADSIKWIAVFVAIALLFVGVIAALIPTYSHRQPEKQETLSNDGEGAGGAILQEPVENGIALSSIKLIPAEFQSFGAAATSESAYVLTATVMPHDTTDKTLALTFDWVNPNSAWASGKAVEDYFSVTSTGENVWTLSVKKAFGEQIQVSVTTTNYVEDNTSEENMALKATCVVDYVKRVEKVTLSYDPELMAFGSTTTVRYDVTYSDGTLQGTFTGSTVSLKLTDYLFSACTTALTNGSYDRSQSISNFANLTANNSQKISVGVCTRFITITGNPGTGMSQWQSAFREYIASEPAQHAYLNMNWSYSYEGVVEDSGTAVCNVRFDAESLVVNAASVTWDQNNIVM